MTPQLAFVMSELSEIQGTLVSCLNVRIYWISVTAQAVISLALICQVCHLIARAIESHRFFHSNLSY
jgi:drug/metabolite transporter superfamily protein YnfA